MYRKLYQELLMINDSHGNELYSPCTGLRMTLILKDLFSIQLNQPRIQYFNTGVDKIDFTHRAYLHFATFFAAKNYVFHIDLPFAKSYFH